MKRSLIVCLLATLSGACLIDTVPLPEKSPSGDRVRIDDPSEHQPPAPGACLGCTTDSQGLSANIYHVSATVGVLLAGVADAAPGNAEIIVTNEARRTVSRFPSNADGSFAGAINAATGDTVELDFVRDNVHISSLSLVLEPPSHAAYAAGDDLDGSVRNGEDPGEGGGQADVTSISRQGARVFVNGRVGSLNPGITVVGVNPRLAQAERTAASADGTFGLSIVAGIGDTLLLFTVEPASSNGGSAPVEITAP